MNYIEKLYDKSWSGRLSQKPENSARLPLEIASKIIPPCGNLLDIGCGDGYMGNLIKDKCHELIGIDISTVAISKAKEKGYNQIHKIDLNEEKLPYPSGYFDVVVCMDVLEHIYNLEPLLKEVCRITKAGGLLIVSTLNMRYLKYIFSLVFKGKFPYTSGDHFIHDGGHCRYFTTKDMTELLDKCGFRVKSREGIIPSPRFKFLIPFSKVPLIAEWFSPALILQTIKY